MSQTYDFAGEPDINGSMSVFLTDVSSAMRTAMYDREPKSLYDESVAKLAPMTPSYMAEVKDAMVAYKLQVYVSYVYAGVYREGLYDNGSFTDGGYVEYTGGVAYSGALSAAERFLSETVTSSVVGRSLSMKPIAGEVVGNGHVSVMTYIKPSGGVPVALYQALNIGNSKGMQMTVGKDMGCIRDRRTVWVDNQLPRTDFLFINTHGAIEDASAVMLESMKVNAKKSVYQQVSAPSFRPIASSRTSIPVLTRQWEMSSGLVTREWAQWWIEEFATSHQVWMNCDLADLSVGMGGKVWIPVVVTPKSDDMLVYDKSKSDAMSVEFSVRSAL